MRLFQSCFRRKIYIALLLKQSVKDQRKTITSCVLWPGPVKTLCTAFFRQTPTPHGRI